MAISRHHKNLLKIYPSKSYLELRVMTSYYPIFCQLVQFHLATEHLFAKNHEVSRFFSSYEHSHVSNIISHSEHTLYLKLEKVEL